MNVCDILKKQILSRSIVYLLVNNNMYPEYTVVTKEIHDEIQMLTFTEQIALFNFTANVSTIAYDYISYSVAYSLCGQLIEARNIRVSSICDQHLYEMIVTTFVNVVFDKENESKQKSLIELCITDKSNFNQLIDTCSNLNFLDVFSTYQYIDENDNYHDETDDYDEMDNYDDGGYDSVS